jgi:hypothetical protein
MTKTKIFGALGPVALAAVVGMGASGAAHALMIDAKATGGVTYAKETLRLDLTSSAVGDATKYYDIMRDHALVAPAQIRKTAQHDNERYTILYQLTGMVFAERVVGDDFASSLDDVESGTDDPADPTNDELGNAEYDVYAGGAKGDDYVVFQVTNTGGVVLPEDVLTLMARFAVSLDGGSIKRTVTNANLTDSGLPEIVWKRVHEISSAVTVKSALNETVMPMDAEAKAMHDFMAFGGTSASPDLTASLGSVMIGVVTLPNRLRNAQALDDDVAAVTTQGSEAAEMMGPDGMWEEVRSLSDIIASKSTTPVANPVMFSGDVSFVSKVALSGSESCSGLAGATDLRVPSKDDPKVLTDTLMATDANDFTSAMHLCLMVDGETAILPGPYSVETMYAPKSSSYAFAAPGGTHALGTITRDGTTVHIPFLTTYEGYNQRLVLRNRSGRNVTYTVMFATEDGIVATPSILSGTLPTMSVEMMRVQDIVELSGGTRTAATVTSNAAGGTLGVATTLVNLEDRSTDTETHAP